MKISLTLTEYISLLDSLKDELVQAVLSAPKEKKSALIHKITFRKVELKKGVFFQFESFDKTKAYTKNIAPELFSDYLSEILSQFTELFIRFNNCEYQLQIEGTTVSGRKKEIASTIPLDHSHNRQKQYLIPEDGKPVDFLIALGLMSKEGQILYSGRDKFRQINHFLQIVVDSLPEKPHTIIDLGCGKAYLTFAMYHYFQTAHITGVDLKADVLEKTAALAEKLGYTNLHFKAGTIEAFQPETAPDLVVALHACNTATDHAIAHAISWRAKSILVAPCCQHEINAQIDVNAFPLILKHGLLKERFSALLTDAIRAELLEEAGYKVQLLEFIDPSHTPKNLLIRATLKESAQKQPPPQALAEALEKFKIRPTLQKLLQ